MPKLYKRYPVETFEHFGRQGHHLTRNHVLPKKGRGFNHKLRPAMFELRDRLTHQDIAWCALARVTDAYREFEGPYVVNIDVVTHDGDLITEGSGAMTNKGFWRPDENRIMPLRAVDNPQVVHAQVLAGYFLKLSDVRDFDRVPKSLKV